MDQHFFRIPFAASGDVAPIPDGPLGDGSLSYQEGFSFDYERNPATDPAAKRIPRDQTNQFYKSVTEVLGDYQRFSTPEWLTAADNAGVAYGYAKGAVVRLAGVAYGSLVNGNTATPGTDATKWREIDIFSVAALTAATVDYTNLSLNTVYVTPAGMAKALREGRFTFATASRVASAYAVTLLGAAFVQGIGSRVDFTVPDASPAGTLTLKVNALPALALLTSQGQDTFVAGDLQPGRPYSAVHNGAAWVLTAPVTSQLAPPPDPLPNRLAGQQAVVPVVTDLNSAAESGWYRAQAGVTNGPGPIAASAIMIQVDAYDASNISQQAWSFGVTSEANRNRYRRNRVAGAWQPWFRVYDTAAEIQQVAQFPGAVSHTAGANAPNGWLIRDGAAVSRTTYADLFAVIGTLYGAGNGTTTFNVPNSLQNGGLFDRAGTPDGVYRVDTFRAHQHTFSLGSSDVGSTHADQGSVPSTTGTTDFAGDAETAPKHMLFLPIIKY